ncbi:hypothetical protein AB0G06_43665 [Nonomuraea dietziae]|uniref:hypothetical protein n=1 Tax=Nonomuraea dietziae TaxID=65515 RepID=UPI0033E2BF7D
MAGSPARKEVGRVGVKVVPDTSDFGSDLKSELSKHANTKLDIAIEADFAKFEADLKRITSGKHTVTINVDADVAAAEAAIARVAQDRTAKLKLDVEVGAIDAAIAKAQQSLAGLGGRKLTINVDLDSAAAEAKLAQLTRTETKRIRVDVDQAAFAKVSQSLTSVASSLTSAFSQTLSSITTVTGALTNLGSTAQSSFGALSQSGSAASSMLSGVNGSILSIVSSIALIGAQAVVVAGVAAILGSIVSAAMAAAVAIGGVLIGVTGLLVLPAIFASIAAAIIGGSKELKNEFSDLKDAIEATISGTAVPMIDALREALQRINSAISEGTPLYEGLAGAFEGAAQAVVPLTEGLLMLAENALVGISNALSELNANGFWDGIAEGLGTLGEAIGNFFSELSTWGPEFAASFQAIADGANILLPSLAKLAGTFATFAPSVITTLAQAFAELFDAFAANKDVYGAAAQAFAAALRDMAGPFEQLMAAFAQMAPEVMAALAGAFERLAQVVSDPAIVEGLTNLATTLIELGAKAAEMATTLAADVGNAVDNTVEFMDLLSGKILDSTTVSNEHLKGLIDQADTTAEKAANLAKQLDASLASAVGDAARHMTSIKQEWTAGLDQMVADGNTKGAEISNGLYERFLELKNKVKVVGGEISQDWVAEMQKLITETRNAGGPLNTAMADNMQKMLDALVAAGPKNVEQVRQFLKGMEDQVTASQIAAFLGQKMDEGSAQVDAGGQKIQQSFAKVLEALPEMIRNAKTPEELSSKLDQMTTIVSSKAPAMGQAFKALGDSMVKGIADADVTTATTTLMTAIQTAITSRVPGIVTAFQQLPTQLASAMTTGSAAVTTAVTTQMTNITTAVTTGVTNAVTAYKKLPTDMAAASNFSATNQKITEAMTKAKTDVTTNVSAMVKELEKLPTAGKKAGELGGFANAIQSEMRQAQQAVSSGVQDILSQLEQLNQTFTTNIVVNITENRTSNGGGDEENIAPNGGAMSMMAMDSEMVEPMALSAPMEQQAQAAEAIMTYARALRDRPAATAAGSSQPQKVYYFTINAAPNVPTEEQLRKQLAYADALYE